ncbi:MAG: SET domain-containing protein [Gammaproteobacteria bacterium]|nr:SET domain-containing protein [Gammaproteobacteria bacterium]
MRRFRVPQLSTPSGHQGAGRGLSESGAVTVPVLRTSPWVQVKSSKIHGKGVFAAKRIPRGTRVIEYLGERISHAEADARYEHLDPADNHTFLFIVDKKIVIDAGVGGNDARYINHSCDGNCESVIEERRVFIEATRTIEAGEELGYDYEIGREPDDPPNIDEIFACRCGSRKCRGTMLWPPERPSERSPAKKKRARQAAP